MSSAFMVGYVRDRFAPNVLSQIFEPYYTTKEKGAGLGLALTKKLIEDHSGQSIAKSELGAGTIFTVRLPRMPDVAPQNHLSPSLW